LDRPSFDEQYLARLRDGDASTHDHFYRYFRPLLYMKLRTRVRAAYLIEEAVQETFLRVLRIVKDPHALDHPERLPAFVHSVCNNVLRELFREEARTAPMPEEGLEPLDPGDCPEKLVADKETRARVVALLQELPERDRRILTAVFLDDQDKDLICQDFHVDREYLRVLLHRALGRLRAIVRDHQVRGAGR
jgi:RNA polymerase sigma-70 factor (ECF subfamily)